MNDASLSNFQIALYRFKLQAQSHIRLPAYAGSTLRGAFSNVFKTITCERKTGLCKNCDLIDSCPYIQIYENSGEFCTFKLDRFKTPPKPFVIEPPVNNSTQIYEKGQEFELRLLLIGKILRHFPYFILALKEMGQNGIGKTRGNFKLMKIEGLNPLNQTSGLIYDADAGTILNKEISFNLIDFIREKSKSANEINKIDVEFVTPTRIKSSGSYDNSLSFKVLIQTLLTRITNLAYHYCDQKQTLNFRNLVNQAKRIEIVHETKEWQDIKRFQSKNNIEMFLGGYIGKIAYMGDIAPFWPWLKFGEILHIGKNCSFGLGKYQASNISESA